MSQLNKEIVTKIAKEISEQLLIISQNNGVSVKLGNCTFNEIEFTTKITGKVLDNDLLNKSYAMELKLLGLPENIIGKRFMLDSMTVKVTGINSRASKTPVEVIDVKTNKKYRISNKHKCFLPIEAI